MRSPALHDLKPEQISAIWAAKTQGHWSFEVESVTYTISKSDITNEYSVTACINATGSNVGSIMSALSGQHYSIEVIPEFRWKWIGTLLLQTKEAMDGILSHDWSARYSRILFLIRKWFIPVRKVQGYDDIRLDKRISKSEWTLLIKKLQTHVHDHLVWDSVDDVSLTCFRLKYSPGKAREFVIKHHLEKGKE